MSLPWKEIQDPVLKRQFVELGKPCLSTPAEVKDAIVKDRNNSLWKNHQEKHKTKKLQMFHPSLAYPILDSVLVPIPHILSSDNTHRLLVNTEHHICTFNSHSDYQPKGKREQNREWSNKLSPSEGVMASMS